MKLLSTVNSTRQCPARERLTAATTFGMVRPSDIRAYSGSSRL
jgi:hypothetical protein